MRIQITVKDKDLIEFYRVHLWSIHEVIKSCRKYSGRKNVKEWTEYTIKIIQQKWNHAGQEGQIIIFDRECIVLD